MPHTAEIISIGTELLLGNIVNTDARDISVALSALGINVYFHTVVGDNPERVRQALTAARSRADIIITTGGLGPTYDDLTKTAVAEAFGKQLVFHEEQAEQIRGFFAARGVTDMTPNNLRQAYLPEGCAVFDNGVGTAPGCAFESDGIHVLMLPGPPRECREMLEKSAVPYLRKLSDAQIYSRNIHIFGMGESAVEAKLETLMRESANPSLAPYAKDGEVMLRATARSATPEEADAMLAPMVQSVLDTLGGVVYGVDTGSLENTVVALLTEQNKTLAVAESCTGGLLAKRITDIPGASKVFAGGVTAYTDAVKTAFAGVPEDLLREKGAVSRETAEAMARGAAERFGADIGVGITGVAGPGADEAGNPAGRVFISVAAGGAVWTRAPELAHFDRERVRTSSASHALDMVRRVLLGLNGVEH